MWNSRRDHPNLDGPLCGGDAEGGSILVCEECGGPASLTIEAAGLAASYCDFCADSVLGFRGLPRLKDALIRRRSTNDQCPFCKTTAEQALQSGLAGCPLCYEALPEVWAKLGLVATVGGAGGT